jgi:hypothetical protein
MEYNKNIMKIRKNAMPQKKYMRKNTKGALNFIVKQVTGKELKNNEVNEVCVWGNSLGSTEVLFCWKN